MFVLSHRLLESGSALPAAVSDHPGPADGHRGVGLLRNARRVLPLPAGRLETGDPGDVRSAQDQGEGEGGNAGAERRVQANLCPSSNQELRSWEEKLTQAALQQKCQEEALRRREQELAEREIHILERELNIIIHQLYRDKPHVERRQGKFRRNRLKLKDGNRISLPSGEAAARRPKAFAFIPAHARVFQISSTKSQCRRLRHTSGAGVC